MHGNRWPMPSDGAATRCCGTLELVWWIRELVRPACCPARLDWRSMGSWQRPVVQRAASLGAWGPSRQPSPKASHIFGAPGMEAGERRAPRRSAVAMGVADG
jgi:hypothetical protein